LRNVAPRFQASHARRHRVFAALLHVGRYLAVPALDIPVARAFLPLLPWARYKGIYGGRGSAKSHFFAGEIVRYCVQSPTDIVCLREIQKSLEFSVKRTIEGKISQYNAGDYFEVQDKRIFNNRRKGVILFEGLQNHTADSLKSLENFQIAAIEEGQSLSQDSLDKLRPTMRRDDSEIWAAWNPDEPDDPIDTFLRPADGILPPDAVVIQANYSDNPWFPGVLRREMEYDKRRDPDKYAHIWLGAYRKNSEARVFKNWTEAEFETPSNARFKFGADWGFSIDPSVLIRCFVGRWEHGIAIPDEHGRHLFIDFEAYEVGCEIDKTPDLFLTVPESEGWPITADSARPETISYMVKHGFPKMVRAVKGPGSIEDGVSFLKAFDIIVHPRCRHTVDELQTYAWKVDPKTKLITNELADAKNNVIDALRYACEQHRRAYAGKKPAAIPIPSVAR
jgi:phage terminase large subunit